MARKEDGKEWRDGLALDQSLPWKIEQREVYYFGRPTRKYAICHGEEAWLLSSVTTVIDEALGSGDQLIEWGIKETLLDFFANFCPDVDAEIKDPVVQHYRKLDRLHDLIEDVVKPKFGKKWSFQSLAAEASYAWDPHLPRMPEHFGWPKLGEIAERGVKSRFRTSETAAEYGTRAHELIELWMKGGGTFVHYHEGEEVTIDLARETEPVRNAVEAFFEFWDSWGLEHKDAEIRLFDVELGIAGTCDAVAIDEQGKLVLLDWKTGSGIYTEAILQAAAYGRMHEKMGLGKIERAYVVRLDKKTARPTIKPAWIDRVEFYNRVQHWGYCVAIANFKDSIQKHLKKLDKFDQLPDGTSKLKPEFEPKPRAKKAKAK